MSQFCLLIMSLATYEPSPFAANDIHMNTECSQKLTDVAHLETTQMNFFSG